MTTTRILVALVFLVAMTGWEFYGFVVEDQGLRYFASDPRRLLLPLVIGVVGGVLALGVSQFSPGIKRNWKLAVLGGVAVLQTALLAGLGMVARSVLTGEIPYLDAATKRWLVAGLVSLAISGGFSWLELYRAWKVPPPDADAV